MARHPLSSGERARRHFAAELTAHSLIAHSGVTLVPKGDAGDGGKIALEVL
jgi:hypothetical protein